MGISVNESNSTKIDMLDVLRTKLDKAKTKTDIMNIRSLIDNLDVRSADESIPAESNAPLVLDAPLEPIKNVGGIDWENMLATFLNQQKAKGRPAMETWRKNATAPRMAGGAPMGAMGLTEQLIAGNEDAKASGSNPLAQYLMLLKRTAGSLASKITGQPISKEQQALDALEKLYGKEGIYQKDALGNPLKGIKKYAGVGRVETPYGRIYVDASGRLTKEPSSNAEAIRTV